MIILEPSDSQDEHSPLKKGIEVDITTPSAVVTTAPPAYAPTIPPDPIPSYQAIPYSQHVTPPRRRSPIRRLLVAFAIAGLVLLLWGAFVDSLGKVVRGSLPEERIHDYGSKLEWVQDTFHRGPHRLDRVRSCQCRPQQGIDDLGRFLPIQYPPQITGSLVL